MSGAAARLVVGVEVHVQLATRTKAFCACPAAFGAEPNANVCPVCLGHPGALPTLNRAALEAAIRGGLALGCRVAPKGRTQWDRKNYFYPDLPKGYQITQYEFPVCEGGEVALSDGTRVRVRRAHLEEDTGKSSHASDGETLVDFNRCGIPLLEIVTEPIDPATPERVEEYLRLLQKYVRGAGASECSMEKGQMRCEPNVSLARSDGSSTAISEVKNINSFAAVREAVAAEAERLKDGPWHAAGKTLPRATYGWDDGAKRTILQRTKESAADYRYFPEPDLPVIPADALEPIVAAATAALVEAEAGRSGRAESTKKVIRKYGLPETGASTRLVEGPLGDCFLKAVQATVDAGIAEEKAGPTVSSILDFMAESLLNSSAGMRISPVDIGTTASDVAKGVFPHNMVKVTFRDSDWATKGGSLGEFLKASPRPSAASSDDAVRAACAEVLAANPDVVAKIKGGKPQAKAALVGQVMKKTRGTADPAKVNALLDELLSRP